MLPDKINYWFQENRVWFIESNRLKRLAIDNHILHIFLHISVKKLSIYKIFGFSEITPTLRTPRTRERGRFESADAWFKTRIPLLSLNKLCLAFLKGFFFFFVTGALTIWTLCKVVETKADASIYWGYAWPVRGVV